MSSSPDVTLPASFLHQVLDRSLNGVLVYEAVRKGPDQPVDFRYRFVNQRAAEVVGLPADGLIGLLHQQVYPDDDHLLTHFSDVVRTGHSVQFAFERRPVRNLPRRWFDVRVEPIDNGVVCSFTDITIERQTAAEAAQTTAMLQNVLKGAQAGIVHVRAVRDTQPDGTRPITDFEVQLVNEVATVLNDIPAGQTIGHRCSELFPHYKAIGLFDRYVSVVETGIPQRFEAPNEGHGPVAWFSVSLVKHDDGLILTFSDISVRKQAEERARRTADRLQSVLNGVPAAITLLEAVLPAAGDPATGDPIDFTTTAFNRQTRPLPDELAASAPPKRLLETHPAYQDNGLFATCAGVYKSGLAAYREVDVVVGDETRCLAHYITRQVDTKGVVVTALDITDRKRAEERAWQTAEALQGVLDGSPASIGLLKAVREPAETGDIIDFQFIGGNQKFAQWLGQPVDQLTRWQVSRVSGALWQADTLPMLSRVVRTGKPHYVEQPNQTGGWLALSVTKQDDGVVITALDITALKDAQQQREHWLDQLRQSRETVGQLAVIQQQVRARGELLRSSSHDLRGSLGVIEGAVNWLTYANSDEERAQLLEMLQRNVQEMAHLLTGLLDFSRLETGQEQVQLAPFDAGDLLRTLGGSVRVLVEGKGLALHLPDEAPLLVEGDARNVLRIAQNLVLNALKYTAVGSITIRWGEAGADAWTFSVADTGPGMDPAVADRLSFRADTGSRAAEPVPELPRNATAGEGIGLLIVKQLCALLRGQLVVKSEPGRGAIFRVTLPRRYE